MLYNACLVDVKALIWKYHWVYSDLNVSEKMFWFSWSSNTNIDLYIYLYT